MCSEVDASKIEPHAGDSPAGANVSIPANLFSSETMRFHDENPAYTYTVVSNPDPSFSVAHANDSDLQTFFFSPTKNWILYLGSIVEFL